LNVGLWILPGGMDEEMGCSGSKMRDEVSSFCGGNLIFRLGSCLCFSIAEEGEKMVEYREMRKRMPRMQGNLPSDVICQS